MNRDVDLNVRKSIQQKKSEVLLKSPKKNGRVCNIKQ